MAAARQWRADRTRQQHSCGRLKRTAAADDDVCGTPVPAGGMVAVLP
jgi:hypothetical protein